MRRRSKAAIGPTVERLLARPFVPAHEAVAFVAMRLDSRLDQRIQRQRVRARLRYATAIGELRPIGKKYGVVEFLRWVHLHYPDIAHDLPRHLRLDAPTGVYEVRGNDAHLSVGLAAELPTDTCQCHVLLRKLDAERQDLRRENEQLSQKLASAMAEIRNLQEHARYREIRKMRSRYGKQGGRGNAK
jgi:hypothetical protein